mgnify:FL=1
MIKEKSFPRNFCLIFSRQNQQTGGSYNPQDGTNNIDSTSIAQDTNEQSGKPAISKIQRAARSRITE